MGMEERRGAGGSGRRRGEEAEKVVDRQKLGTGAWDGRYRMERVAVARQRPVDESGITDCVSSFVVRLVVVLLAVLPDRIFLAVQFVAVLLSLVVGMLLFSSFCSALICVVDLFCAAARRLLFVGALALVFRLALCA